MTPYIEEAAIGRPSFLDQIDMPAIPDSALDPLASLQIGTGERPERLLRVTEVESEGGLATYRRAGVFAVPVDCVPVVPMEVPVDPAPILLVVPVDVVPVLAGLGWVVVRALVLSLPTALFGGRTTTGDTRGPSFRTSSAHGAEASVDSVAEVQRRSTRSASTPDGLEPGMVWARAEPASRSAASEANDTGKDLFMAYSYSDCCSGLKSPACRDINSLEQAVAEFCSAAHGRPRVAEETNRDALLRRQPKKYCEV
jgi:hypothetical protein